MPKHSRGFSLIEILISLILFTTLSLSMMNIFKQTTKAQDQMEKLIKKRRILTNISYAIRKDLQNPLMTTTDNSYLAYHVYWSYLRDPQWNNGKVESDYITHYLDDEGYYDKTSIFPVTGFTGREQNFYFTNAQSYSKTAYILEDCPPPSADRCLFRKTAPIDDKNLDDFPEKDSQSTSLLEGVNELSIQYLNAKNKEWTSTFQSEYPTNFYSFPLTFPLAIKMEIELENSEPLSLSIPIYPSILSHKIHSPTKIQGPPKKDPLKILPPPQTISQIHKTNLNLQGQTGNDSITEKQKRHGSYGGTHHNHVIDSGRTANSF